MKKFQAIFFAVIFLFIPVLSPVAAAQGQAGHIMVSSKDLKWVDVPSLPPGAQVAVIEGPLNEAKPFTFRLRFPPNYTIPAHWHPAIERVTVLSGTFNMGVGDKFDRNKTTALSVSDMAILSPRTNHFAWTKEETIVQLNGAGPWEIHYVNPKDDPRKK